MLGQVTNSIEKYLKRIQISANVFTNAPGNKVGFRKRAMLRNRRV